MLFIFAFIIALVVTMLLIPPVMKWADKIGAIDIPDARKVHTQAIPRVGGIAMVAGSVISILLLAELDQQVLAILAGFLVIWGFGLWDDKCDLNYKVKFLGQLLAVVIVVTWGDVIVRTFPFIDDHIPDYLAIPLTIFALVGITNAINLSDGLDGLAGGTSLITISIIALLAYDAGGEMVVLISMAVAGSILGFLRHNTYPARLFMGDTGSQFLGFSLGVMVIVLSQSVNSAMSPVIPLLILGLPILDTFAVMIQRLYERRSPFSPDKNHIHHKLLALGLGHYEAVFAIYLLQSTFVAVAYFMLYESDLILSVIYVVLSAFVIGIFSVAPKGGLKMGTLQAGTLANASRYVSYLHEKGLLVTVPTYFLKVMVPVLFIVPAAIIETVSFDMSILSLLLLVMIVLSPVIKFDKGSVLEKAVIYVLAVMTAYQLSQGLLDEQVNLIVNYLLIFVAIAFALRVRFCRDKTFQVTPLDYLVIVLVVVVPNLPETHIDGDYIGEMAIKLVVLFYACEALLGMKQRKWNLLHISAVASLVVMSLRGVI